jgi:hypothetical protein
VGLVGDGCMYSPPLEIWSVVTLILLSLEERGSRNEMIHHTAGALTPPPPPPVGPGGGWGGGGGYFQPSWVESSTL